MAADESMMKKKKKRVAKKRRVWEFLLYVADTSPRSVLATGNLRTLCERYLEGNCRITIVDIVKQPDLARKHDILAIPTLVRVMPGPQRTVIGTLENAGQVLNALEIQNDQELVSLLPNGISPVGHA
jgi:circadian clock protein KaiB